MPSGGLRATRALNLSIQFVFLARRDPTDADVIASVVAALQQMRTWNKPKRLESIYPHAVVVSPANYLGASARFNDDILRIAILRMAKREELQRWEGREESKRRNSVAVQLLERGIHCSAIRLEFAIAILAGKLPNLTLVPSELEMLTNFPDEDFLRQVLRRG